MHHGKEDGKDTLSPSRMPAGCEGNLQAESQAAWPLEVSAECGSRCRQGRRISPRAPCLCPQSQQSEGLAGIGDDGHEPHGAEEVIRIYGKRWGIEVFFKVCKSFLRLEKDCRSLSYDAMTAHVSIVFTRYMFLAVEQRECKDARSLGELFYLSVDELPDVCFVEAMRLLLLLFVERLQEKPMLDEGEIHEQLQGFLKELPVLL